MPAPLPPQIKDAVDGFDLPDAELVIGVACAVGADYEPIQASLQRILKQYGYEISVTRVSDLIGRFTTETLPQAPEGLRINCRMDAGNAACRAKRRRDLWALASIAEINAKRPASGALKRTAHLLLSLKRPEEVATLRKVYGDGFFLVGVFGTEQERLNCLIERNVPKQEALDLIRRDEEELADEYGQHTADTFQLSDVFVQLRNQAYEGELERFVSLVFSNPYVTPTESEHNMFLAYAASLRSGQLGRQVGAAIATDTGDVLAVGCNDVPKPGGGLYWPGPLDSRDHILGEDTNDKQRDRLIDHLLAATCGRDERRLDLLRQALEQTLKSAPGTTPEVNAELVRAVHATIAEFDKREVSQLRGAFRSTLDVTEYGRAVHAEMDALLTCARSGVSPQGATLYTTTFPCHNCTRHVIAAGIKRVFYIEPYAKSKAHELHEDAIIVEERVFGKQVKGLPRLPFRHFVGIGPRRYFDLFSLRLSRGYELTRKKQGRTLLIEKPGSWTRVPLSPYSYLKREQIAVKILDDLYSPQLGFFDTLNPTRCIVVPP